MLNYLKSECYRITRSKGIYVMTAALCGLVLALNVVLALCNHYLPDFRYGTFRFSLNTFTSATYVTVILGALVAGMLFTDDLRNGILKNAVSYGISRTKLLLGKCVVCLVCALLMLCIVAAVYIGGAYLLLDNPEWLPLREMLLGIAASLPSAAASLTFTIVLTCLFQKEMNIVIWWAIFYYLIPLATFFLGLKIPFLEKLAEWMPYFFLRIEAQVSFTEYHCLWDTSQGLTKCIVSGIVGILLFLSFGIWKFRKQDI